MRLHSSASLCVASITILLAGCSSGGQTVGSPITPVEQNSSSRSTTATETQTSQATGRQLTVALQAGFQSPVAFTTYPGAVCTFPGSGWTFTADASGNVKIFAAPTSSQATTDSIQCVAGGRTDQIRLNFTSGNAVGAVAIATGKAAAPVAPSAAAMTAFVAQNGFDPRTASDAVLEAHDLPPRPGNALSNPAGNVGWYRAVFTPNANVVRTGVPIANAFGNPSSPSPGGGRITPDYGGGVTPYGTLNWSGFAANGVAGTWNTVRGYWDDPNSYQLPLTPGYSVMWVGIDGLGTGGSEDTTVYQDGSESDRLVHSGVQYTNTFLWYEAYPNPEEYWHATTPGDEEYCTVYKVVGQSVNANFYCKDITESQVNETTLNVGSGFVGDSVEWIVERPHESGIGTYYFADYGTAAMTQAEAVSGNTTIFYDQISTVSSYNLYQITLYGANNDIESESYNPGGGDGYIDWNWENYQ